MSLAKGKSLMTVVFLATIFIATQASAQDTINIVQLDPLSGPFQDIGERAVMGTQFAVDEINAAGGLLGKKVKLLAEDNQLKPDVAVRKATKAIMQDNAKFMIQLTSTAVARALMDVAEKYKVIHLTTGSLTDYLTGKEFNPYFFRTVPNATNLALTYAEFFKGKPFRKFYLLNQDYAYGHAVADSFKAVAKREIPDLVIVGDDYHPLATKDFGPYISKIIASGAEIVYTGNYGTDLEVLIKQGAQMGLKARYASNELDDFRILSHLGDAGIGHFVASLYMPTIDNKENKIFIEKWHAKYKNTDRPWPTGQIGWCYNGIMWLAEAIKKAKSFDSEAVIKAWEGMEYNGVYGRQIMRACDHQSLQAGLVGEVQAKSDLFNHPFPGKPTIIPMEKVAVPPQETGNPRCK